MKARELVWTEDRWSHSGKVGKVELFTYTYDSLRSKGDAAGDEKPWILTSRLPGQGRWRCKDQETCKQLAARLLERFLKEVAE